MKRYDKPSELKILSGTQSSAKIGYFKFFPKSDGFYYTDENGNEAKIGESGSGKFEIKDSSGNSTFYETLQAAINNATAGQTIQVFADYVETGDVEIILKDGVTINGNGHTYTQSHAGTDTACFKAKTTNGNYYIYNLKVKRINGNDGYAASSALSVAVGSGQSLYLDGSKFIASAGCGIQTAINCKIYNGFGWSDGSAGNSSAGIGGNTGMILFNCIGYGTTANGINVPVEAYNCIGFSTTAIGFNMGGGGFAHGCRGVSYGGVGFYMQGTAIQCSGYSSANFGIRVSNTGSMSNCIGYSTADAGIAYFDNADAYSCTGYSTVANGIRSNGSGNHNLYNCNSISLAAEACYAIWTGIISNCVFESKWNNANGHALRVATSITTGLSIVNSTLVVNNTSAYCLYASDQVTVKYNNNVFAGATIPVNSNIVQGISNNPDSQGNIKL